MYVTNAWMDGRMDGCMDTCIHACMYVRTDVCMLVCLSVCLSVLYACMLACMYIYLCIYVSMYLSIRLFIFLYICIYVSMHLCIYVSMCLCVYVSMYLCIYVYDWMWGDGVRATVWSGKHGEWLQSNPLLGVSPRFLISSYREPIPIETQFWHLVRSAAPSGKRPFGQPGSKIEIYPVLIAIFFNNMSLGKW